MPVTIISNKEARALLDERTNLLGAGCSREVYEHPQDKDKVIKYSDWGGDENLLEVAIYEFIEGTTLEPYFAKLYAVSEDGTVLIAERLEGSDDYGHNISRSPADDGMWRPADDHPLWEVIKKVPYSRPRYCKQPYEDDHVCTFCDGTLTEDEVRSFKWVKGRDLHTENVLLRGDVEVISDYAWKMGPEDFLAPTAGQLTW